MLFPLYYAAAELSESAGRLTRHSSCRRWDRLSSPSHRAALRGRRRRQSGEMKSVLCREQRTEMQEHWGRRWHVFQVSQRAPFTERRLQHRLPREESELKQASETRLILLLHLLHWSSAHRDVHHERLSTWFNFTELSRSLIFLFFLLLSGCVPALPAAPLLFLLLVTVSLHPSLCPFSSSLFPPPSWGSGSRSAETPVLRDLFLYPSQLTQSTVQRIIMSNLKPLAV